MKAGESAEQIKCLAWLKSYYPTVFKSTFHPANEFAGNVAGQVKRKRMGVKPGVPDLIHLFPVEKLGKIGLAVELKAAPPAKFRVTKEQKEWLLLLVSLGYEATICAGFEDYKQVIKRCYTESVPDLSIGI